eukprot:7091619-Lingulodinium_polyedra.AAC.1
MASQSIVCQQGPLVALDRLGGELAKLRAEPDLVQGVEVLQEGKGLGQGLEEVCQGCIGVEGEDICRAPCDSSVVAVRVIDGAAEHQTQPGEDLELGHGQHCS